MKPSFLFLARIALLACGLASAGAAREAELAPATLEALTNLETAVRQAAVKEPADKERRVGRYDDYRGSDLATLSQLRGVVTRGDAREMPALLGALSASGSTEAVRTAATALTAAIRAENDAKAAALHAEADAVFAAAGKAIENAQVPADLDATLGALTKFKERETDPYRSNTAPELRRAEAAYRFAVSWQDYLAAAGAHDWQRATQELREAANNHEAELLPRSKVLAQVEGVTTTEQKQRSDTVREILSRTKSLDDLPAALDALAEWQRQPGMASQWDSVPSALKTNLSVIRDAYSEYRAGLPFSLQLHPSLSYSQNNATEAERLALPHKTQLMRLVVPRFLGVEDKLGTDEPLDDYFDRIRARAFEQFDIPLVARVQEFRNKWATAGNQSQLPAALQLLLTARNQEEAGQFFPAVISYEKALRTGGDLIPAKVVGAKLDAIKAAHPQEYDLGVRKAVEQNEYIPPSSRGAENGPFTISVPGR